MMFDPTKITTFVALAAAAIWAICYVSNRRRSVVLATLAVTLVALGTAAALEWTRHVDACDEVSELRLNEVCAEGEVCDGGKDFIEVFNPNKTPVSLACYAIGDQRSVRGGIRLDANPVLFPPGDVAAGAVRAWNEDQLGFRISWQKGDSVALFKLKLEPGKNVHFVEKERVLVNDSASYLFRTQDGTRDWRQVSHEEAVRLRKVGSFGKLSSE